MNKKETKQPEAPAKPAKVRKYKKELKGPGVYAVKPDTVVDSVIVREDGSVVITYHKEVK